MIRFLINMVVYFASAFLGLFVADLVLPDLSVNGGLSYLLVAGIFAIIQAVLSPLVSNITEKSAPAFMGGIGLVTTFVALFLTSIISSGLSIKGLSTWLLATLIIWLVTATAAFLLPVLVVRRVVKENRSNAA